MEHNNNNNATTTSTNIRQQHQTRDQSQLSQKLQEQHQPQQQTNNNEHQQQFCLRWHNHQTSLLSTLPVLLDQSHLTDVTISAEGRTLRAHRVVLSACSSFFLEIFRTLETTHHPVIIIPGASFSAIVALLTFMYSGEVNVYEEQIPTLLSLAETLGIKGLADVHNNLQKSSTIKTDKEQTDKEESDKSLTPPSPHAATTTDTFSLPQTPVATSSLNTSLTSSTLNPLLNPVLNSKFPSPLENLFLKSLQFYPNLMHQPLNFSQTALNKTSELLAKYQQQCNLYQANLGMNPKDLMPMLHNEEDSHANKRFCAGLEKKSSSLSAAQQAQQNQMTAQQQKDIKRIDKIVENLRGGGTVSGGVTGVNSNKSQSHENLTNSPTIPSHLQNQLSPLNIKTSMENYTSSNPSPLLSSKPSIFSTPTSTDASAHMHSQLGYNISVEDQMKLQQHLDKYAASCARTMEVANENLKNEASRILSNEKLPTPQSPQGKTPSNSKLYATCFICHKQLSNQYNLRVHLETHQNVRYACNVCSHVSRSKDALRKHVSYRHPGAPSPCESEARRKRANKLLATQLNAANLVATSPTSGEITPTSPNTMPPHFQCSTSTTTTTSNELNCNEASQLTAAQLSSAYQLFMPNQFHLAAAAANAAQQQHLAEQQQQQVICATTTSQNKEYTNAMTSLANSTQMNNTITNSSSETTISSLNNNNNNNNTPKPSPTTTTDFQNTTNNNNNDNDGESRISPTVNP